MADPLVENGLPVSGTTAQRPVNASQGQNYYDTTLGMLMVYNDGSGTGSPSAGWNPATGIHAEMVTFTEDGAGTYTGAVTVPANATILDIVVDGVALWAAASSATMVVGDGTDPDGYFTGVNVKATDLLAGESLSFALAGGKAGAYIANSAVTPRFSTSARTVSGVITSVGAGTTGRTRMTVVYCLPRVKAATKA